MMDGMNSMMGWMMGLGLAGWVILIALLVSILVVLVRILSRSDRPKDSGPGPSSADRLQH